MKRFTLLVTGILLGGIMLTQQLYSRSHSFSDGDQQGVVLTEKEIKVFPNPSNGMFQLELEYQGTEKVSAKVYDITGKQVMDISEDLVREDTSVTAQVNLESPKSGIYFLRVSVGNKVVTKKIIIR